ncbi:helix-turn-helix domain-containing protein [Alteriqipengyuania sp. WL0013]|uniref:winged helix-turn-helix transcriptional regulator n=1 Tax=Alteriqipengyuania sp. WL0013 TaxID=3110773 RepID=UPI002CC9B56E|nr:helix-turn-helix domain-containing protein [Alteriqipengyuania sp. WL0013]MEB3415397.1 helix-turn-helix domain-containing protein [Alteriqipengyuania sp. WL0013]
MTLAVPDAPACQAVNDLLSRIGDKWTVRVVMALAEEDLRFSELRRRIDSISQRMLTRTLRALERDGIVSRTVTPSVPVRVDYALTPLGESLSAPVAAIATWAMQNQAAMMQARADYDAADAE